MEEKFKQRFKELFFDQIGKIVLEIKCNPRYKNCYIKNFYNKSGNFLGCYDSKNKIFWVSDSNLWSKFESEFNYNYLKIKELTTNILEERYKLNGITIQFLWKRCNFPLEERYKLNGITIESEFEAAEAS